jgi:hypothetical protein
MRTYNNSGRQVLLRGLILVAFAELALPMIGQVPAPDPKAEPAAAVSRPLPLPSPTTNVREDPMEPRALPLYSRSFFVDPYQFDEVVRPKLPILEGDHIGRTWVILGQWFAQLGVDMNRTNGKSMFWHEDGRLSVRASSADLDSIGAAITAMGREYSGKSHPRLETRVIHLAPDAFEEGLRKLTLLPEAATNSAVEVSAAVLRHFAELGVDLARPKTLHYDRSRGCLELCATHADLEIVEPEVVRLLVNSAQGILRRDPLSERR